MTEASGSAASLMAFVGPKHESFVNDQRLITAIMGPVGSAKTTGCIRKIIMSALWQRPQRDGVRRVRWACVRDTYGQLESNVMVSWFSWFPKTKENFNGKDNKHVVQLHVVLGDKLVPIEIEMLFRAMGDHKAEDVLRGLELTGLWLNETDTLAQDVFLYGMGRISRYPQKKDGGCAWFGIICDFNAPDIDNWTYDLLVEEKTGLTPEREAELRAEIGPRFGIGFYRQPGGRSKDPPPENLQNLEKGYYGMQELVYAKRPNMLRRMVDNEFGTVVNGQPVWPEFNREIHVAKETLQPVRGYPIHAGIDGGRTPAMVFFQLVEGQFRVLRELVIYDPGKTDELARLGPKAFAEDARAFAALHFPNERFGTFFYDPSIDYGQDDEEEDWLRFFRREFKGVSFRPGGHEGNRVTPRIESVRERLVRMPGGRPAFLVSPECRLLIRAMSAGYVFMRLERKDGSGRFQDTPRKDDFSHIADAVQHGSIGADINAAVLDDIDARARSRPQGKVHHDGYAAAGGSYH
jgi:hypothetical protein